MTGRLLVLQIKPLIPISRRAVSKLSHATESGEANPVMESIRCDGDSLRNQDAVSVGPVYHWKIQPFCCNLF